ncbi:amidase signature enzyme [Dentipellis sp. KUC8613]|nr:amidase signature enzyme [Dentipellis sp. KUC8613]
MQTALSGPIWVLVLLIYQIFGPAFASSRHVPSGPRPVLPDLYEASIAELQSGLEQGLFTSVDLVKNIFQAYFARIDEVNLKGPALRAVIEMNPSALSQAAALDSERKATGPRSTLHGIPILLKDNIATEASDGMNTTAGSFALLGSIPPRDATVAIRKPTRTSAPL